MFEELLEVYKKKVAESERELEEDQAIKNGRLEARGDRDDALDTIRVERGET